MSALRWPLVSGPVLALLPAAHSTAAAPAVADAPTGFWTLRSATGDCDGLERAAPEAHFTVDGRFSFASRSDGTLEVRIPESACTLAFVPASGLPDWRHAQTQKRLQQCVQVQVTQPGAGPPVTWEDAARFEMRVRSPAVLASARAERSTVEPGSHRTWPTSEHALVGHPAGTRLRVAACPELTLAGIPPEQMPTEPVVVDVRILSRSAGAAVH